MSSNTPRSRQQRASLHPLEGSDGESRRMGVRVPNSLRAHPLSTMVVIHHARWRKLQGHLANCGRTKRMRQKGVQYGQARRKYHWGAEALLRAFMASRCVNWERRYLFVVCRLLVFAVLFILCVTYNLPWQRQHMAIVSSTLFSNSSSSYPANTMVVLFSAPKRFWPPWPLTCVSRNATHSLRRLARVRYAFTPIWICGWAVYLAVCGVVEEPVEFGLRDIHLSSRTVSLPYREAQKDRLGVVACFSPLFYNERWQLIIPTLEIYRQLGVDLQVYYIQSMLEEILKFLAVYQRLGFVRLEGWTRVSVLMPNGGPDPDLSYDPNTELEWRNQAAAHTDCLLRYKEAAEFIIISDIDDVLIPRLGATFLDEFRLLAGRYPPSAAGFSYNRYNTELLASSAPHEFSLASLINGARVATEWEDPKYVVKPSHVQSAWLHWPGIIDLGKMYIVPNDWNFMLHFRNWSMIDYFSRSIPRHQRMFSLFNYQVGDVINPKRIALLHEGFRRFLNENSEAGELFEQLPQKSIYYPMIADCYNRIFYSTGKHPENCPGPQRCVLPPIPGLRCAIARKHFKHTELNSHVFLHYSREESKFAISDTGCRM